MAADGTSLPEGALVVAHGCGQNFPAVEAAADVAEEENRRVEVFFFRDGIDPRPPDALSEQGSPHYPAWLELVDQERTFRPSQAGYGTLLVVTDLASDLGDLAIKYRLFSTDEVYDVTLEAAAGTDREGYLELLFEDMPRGSFYTLEVFEADETTTTVFTDVPYPELGRLSTDLDEHAKHPTSWDEEEDAS